MRVPPIAAIAVLCSACASGGGANPVSGWPHAVETRPLGAGTGERDAAAHEIVLASTALVADALDGPASSGGDDSGEPGSTGGQPSEDEATRLAKQVQNPVASLIAVPFESNWKTNAGAFDRTQYTLTIKPVYPQTLDEEWNWIHRALIPVMDQPRLFEGGYDRFGLGDVTYQGFLSPAKPGKLIWGAGPVVTFPTATDDVLGSGKWLAGPALLGLSSNGPWVYGALVTNQWQIASHDTGRPRVGIGSIQPFVNYNMKDGWYFKASPTLTANWKADDGGDVWTVPVGMGIGKIHRIGGQAMNFSIDVYHNVHAPDEGADWSVFFTVNFLFPK